MDFIDSRLRSFQTKIISYYKWKIYERIDGYDNPRFIARRDGDNRIYVCLLKYKVNIIKLLNEIRQNENFLIIPILDYIIFSFTICTN